MEENNGETQELARRRSQTPLEEESEEPQAQNAARLRKASDMEAFLLGIAIVPKPAILADILLQLADWRAELGIQFCFVFPLLFVTCVAVFRFIRQ